MEIAGRVIRRRARRWRPRWRGRGEEGGVPREVKAGGLKMGLEAGGGGGRAGGKATSRGGTSKRGGRHGKRVSAPRRRPPPPTADGRVRVGELRTPRCRHAPRRRPCRPPGGHRGVPAARRRGGEHARTASAAGRWAPAGREDATRNAGMTGQTRRRPPPLLLPPSPPPTWSAWPLRARGDSGAERMAGQDTRAI